MSESELNEQARHDDHQAVRKENERLTAELAQAQSDLESARGCKPDEFTHVLASERAARSELAQAREENYRLQTGWAEMHAAFAEKVKENERLAKERDEFEQKGIHLCSEYGNINLEKLALKARVAELEMHLREAVFWVGGKSVRPSWLLAASKALNAK